YISTSPFSPLIDDEKKFFQFRQKLLGEPTPRQSQVALSAATADIDNDPDTDEPKQPNESTTKIYKTNITNYQEKLFIHYTHEKRFNVFKRDMHHVYEDTFKSTPAMYTNLIVGNRNRRQASDELIHKRPTQPFLLNHITQSKHQNKTKKKQPFIYNLTYQYQFIIILLGQQKKKNKRIQKQQTISQTSTA
ncbi:unnamed protein product, partial [Rotaria socialis]